MCRATVAREVWPTDWDADVQQRRERKSAIMTDQSQPPTDTDPSGNIGPTEHPPIHSEPGARRMLISSVWAGTPAYVLTEHGMDVRSWNPDCSWYRYGTEYCLNGCQHPGMDLSLEFGTELTAAEGGTVVYAGPDQYYEPNHVNIETAAGEVHIYGHMSEVDPAVAVGGSVVAGQRLGRSGFSNSAHLHFERRAPNSGCGSGYAAVDPEPTLVGGGAPQPAFNAGDRIKVVDPPLRFRTGPGVGASVIAELQGDAELIVVSGPEHADGHDWYRATRSEDGTEGWLAGRYCALVTA